MVLASIHHSMIADFSTRWEYPPNALIVLDQAVQQWLDCHGFEYALYRIATRVEYIGELVYANGGHRVTNRAMYACCFYIEFQEPHQLMLFKLAHDGVVHATEKDLGYI